MPVPKKRGPRTPIYLKGEEIKARRVARGETQEEFCARMEVAVARLRVAEAGKAISHYTAVKIANGLEVDDYEILRALPEHKIYRTPRGYLELRENKCYEYQEEKEFAVFDKFHTTADHVIFVCTTRETDDGRKMLIRIPIQGGSVEWTWENPLNWVAFTVASPT